VLSEFDLINNPRRGIVSISMRCCHLQHKGETWTLDLRDEQAQIRDAAGKVRGEYPRTEVNDLFLMPSFSESIKQFRAAIDGEMWFFDVAKDDLKQIKAYLNQSLASGGIDAMLPVRNRGFRDLLIGLAAIVVGVGVTVASYLNAAQKPEGGEYSIVYGAVLFGIIMFGKGIYGLVRYQALKKLLESNPGGEQSS
jgi:hypothetical protein